jgi:uncharacterized protein YkwD
MMSPSPVQPSRRARVVQLCLLLLLAVSCGGGGDLDAARGHLRRGDLARAEAALGEARGRSADDLRMRIAERHDLRWTVSHEMERLAGLDPWAEREGLELLLEDLDDTVLIERVELAISRAVDRAAESAGVERVAVKDATEERVVRARLKRMEEGLVVPETPVMREGRGAEAAPGDVEPAPSQGGLDPERSPAPVEEHDTAEPAIAAVESAAKASGPTSEQGGEGEPGAVDSPQSAAELIEPITAAVLLEPDLAKGEKLLIKATSARRAGAWEKLDAYGEHARPHLGRAIEARWARTLTAVTKSPSIKMLERLAQDRVELDYRREQALELIFDEEEYFYPYRPPECPPKKARKYWPVQQRVDELVRDLREVWESPRKVKLASSFREDVEELLWCRERGAELEIFLDLGEDIPAWVLLVPPGEKSIDLHGFAWDEDEARRLANDRAVLAFNVENWRDDALEELAEEEFANSEEVRQVEITNEYRRMFGRKVLAWNPKLQASSDGHSDYMAKTGDFGHYEEGDEERHTPFDRMRLVGYNFGISENCHMGGGSPQGAHESWCKSSGHHRNILMAGHTEMASAVNGRYWTQNYGTDKEFRSEIDTWLD